MDRASTASTNANTLTIGSGGISLTSGAGAVTIGDTLATGHKVNMRAAASLNITNDSGSLLTFNRTWTSTAASGTTTLSLTGSGTGGTKFVDVISDGTTALLAIAINTSGGTTLLDTANSYTGGTTLTAGTLGLGSSSALGSGGLTLNGGRLASSVSARTLANAVTVGGNFTLGGLGNSITLNGTVDLGGASRTITLDNSATIGGVISSGGLALSSSNASRTLTLTGTNDYSGTTQVFSGTLLVNGNQSAATGAVSIAANATLGGGGTVGGATSFTGASVHAPGSAAATVGSQSFSSTVTYGSGTIFSWDLNTLTGGDVTDPGPGASNAGTGTYDQVTATGAITGGSAVFKVVLAAGDSFGDAFWNTDKSWTNIFTGGSGSSASLAALFSGFDASGGLDAAGVVTGRGQFTLSSAANTLSWTAVPEPSSALAGLLIAAGLVRRRRI